MRMRQRVKKNCGWIVILMMICVNYESLSSALSGVMISPSFLHHIRMLFMHSSMNIARALLLKDLHELLKGPPSCSSRGSRTHENHSKSKSRSLRGSTSIYGREFLADGMGRKANKKYMENTTEARKSCAHSNDNRRVVKFDIEMSFVRERKLSERSE